ncbi:aldose 1-epimerase family protein [Amnibacterium sp. CER49]|uniref:aldose 1-epimerase family protein n=1 Tax=Amnibacterium sp. CER49 TaxID=3039161 RepID=UPI00244B14D4|nr:aldose 1-epimerase family protein [Amnibacterium sp. CER49]MDH2443327.1 aldose 1-epimerase family protein [Amnibacterium sp. CER49]
MRVDGSTYTRAQLVDRVGSLSQIASATPVSFEDGAARGSRMLAVRVAGGISCDVLVDRGLDIGYASAGGTPLSWLAPRGPASPAFAEHGGTGWARTFGGGLLTTCGMAHVGPPDAAPDGQGLHGRVSSLPAEGVTSSVVWDGDEPVVVISGTVVETTLVGPTLERSRTITIPAGRPELVVEDVVTNVSGWPAPHMYRFHPNLGFPLVRPDDVLDVPGAELLGWRADAPPRDETWNRVAEPRADGREEVLYVGGRSAPATRALLRRAPGAEPYLELDWSAETLPVLVVWKLQRVRSNVLAVEPSTVEDDGRAAAERNGRVIMLQPDESRTYRLRLRLDLRER